MSVERLPAWQDTATTPPTPDKVRCVDAVRAKRTANHTVVSTIWSNVQVEQHLPNRGRHGRCGSQLFASVLRPTHALTDESVET